MWTTIYINISVQKNAFSVKVWHMWSWSEVTCQWICMCGYVLARVKSNEFSLQGLRCCLTLSSTHCCSGMLFAVSICPRFPRALFQYAGWMIKCAPFVKKPLSSLFLACYTIDLNLLKCKIGSLGLLGLLTILLGAVV